MIPDINDPRLFSPQCISLVPVEVVHENPWFTIRNRGGYYTIEYNQPQVLILPIMDKQAAVMVRAIRPIIADSPLEFPAGAVKKNEKPIFAARRELLEETGIEVNDINRFEILPPIAITPRSPYLPYIFKVDITSQEFNQRREHDQEVENVESIQFRDILTKVAVGEIYIGLHIAIIIRYFLKHFDCVFDKLTH